MSKVISEEINHPKEKYAIYAINSSIRRKHLQGILTLYTETHNNGRSRIENIKK